MSIALPAMGTMAAAGKKGAITEPVSANKTGPGTITLTLASDGSASQDSGTPSTWDWLVSGSPSDYDVRLTQSTSDIDSQSGTFGVWLNLGTTREWSWTQGEVDGQSTRSFEGTLEIRGATSELLIDSDEVSVTFNLV